MTDPLARIRRASKRRATAETEWREAVKAAHAAGIPIRRIGDAAGVSHVRVLQLTREK